MPKIPTRDFNKTFADNLRDPKFVRKYLHYAYKEGPKVYFLAIEDVAKANSDNLRYNSSNT